MRSWSAISTVNKAVSNLTGCVCGSVESRLMPHIFIYVLAIIYRLPPSTGWGGPFQLPQASVQAIQFLLQPLYVGLDTG